MNRVDSLFKACIYGDVKLLKRSLKDGGNVNKQFRKWPPLRWAIQEGHLNIIKVLVDHGANIKKRYSDGCTPLEQAVCEEHTSVIKYLINCGVDVNQKSSNNGTALHMACAYGQLEMAKLLIKNGADPKRRDNDGWTPRSFAGYYRRKALLKLLDERVANKNTPQQKLLVIGLFCLLLMARPTTYS